MMCSSRLARAGGLALMGTVASGAHAAMLFSGSEDHRAAQVVFDVDGSNLIVSLANTSGFDVTSPNDLLTALFFDISPAGHDDDSSHDRASAGLTLSPISAVLGPSSTVLFGASEPDGGVGGEWAFLQGLDRAPEDAGFGISSAGLGLFGQQDLFGGVNLSGPVGPSDNAYSISSPSDDPTTGDLPVTGGSPLIRHEVVFTLTGLPTDFDLEWIDDVSVLYGASLFRSEDAHDDDDDDFDDHDDDHSNHVELEDHHPGVPTPGAAVLIGISGIMLLSRRRRAI